MPGGIHTTHTPERGVLVRVPTYVVRNASEAACQQRQRRQVVDPGSLLASLTLRHLTEPILGGSRGDQSQQQPSDLHMVKQGMEAPDLRFQLQFTKIG